MFRTPVAELLSLINFAHQRYSNTFSFGTGRLGSKGFWDRVTGVSKSRSLVETYWSSLGLVYHNNWRPRQDRHPSHRFGSVRRGKRFLRQCENSAKPGSARRYIPPSRGTTELTRRSWIRVNRPQGLGARFGSRVRRSSLLLGQIGH